MAINIPGDQTQLNLLKARVMLQLTLLTKRYTNAKQKKTWGYTYYNLCSSNYTGAYYWYVY